MHSFSALASTRPYVQMRAAGNASAFAPRAAATPTAGRKKCHIARQGILEAHKGFTSDYREVQDGADLRRGPHRLGQIDVDAIGKQASLRINLVARCVHVGQVLRHDICKGRHHRSIEIRLCGRHINKALRGNRITRIGRNSYREA